MTKQPTQHLRDAVNHSLDAIQMLSFNEGFEAATNAIDEMAIIKHNECNDQASETLHWAVSELRGENA